MANMQATKTPMPEQDPNVRNKNFKEVTLGYTAEMAINEAKRCLQCKKPQCVEGCPVNIRIPEFIQEVAEGDFAAAYEIITIHNSLPALSGRVCPQETQCESSASAATRASRSPSAVLSASSPTGTVRTSTPCRRRPSPTA